MGGCRFKSESPADLSERGADLSGIHSYVLFNRVDDTLRPVLCPGDLTLNGLLYHVV